MHITRESLSQTIICEHVDVHYFGGFAKLNGFVLHDLFQFLQLLPSIVTKLVRIAKHHSFCFFEIISSFCVILGDYFRGRSTDQRGQQDDFLTLLASLKNWDLATLDCSEQLCIICILIIKFPHVLFIIAPLEKGFRFKAFWANFGAHICPFDHCSIDFNF